jgi:hypothetical protein
MANPTTPDPRALVDDPVFDVHRLLEEAAVLERAGDETGAISRLRLAERLAAGELADDVALALDRVRAHEREWRAEVARREAAFDARERAEAGEEIYA